MKPLPSSRKRPPLALVVLGLALAVGRESAAQQTPLSPADQQEAALKLRGHRIDTRATLYEGEPKLQGHGPSAAGYRPDLEIMRQVASAPATVDAKQQHDQVIALYAGHPAPEPPRSVPGKPQRRGADGSGGESGLDATLLGYAVVPLLALGAVGWRIVRTLRARARTKVDES